MCHPLLATSFILLGGHMEGLGEKRCPRLPWNVWMWLDIRFRAW